jgi:hypothetical protein
MNEQAQKPLARIALAAAVFIASAAAAHASYVVTIEQSGNNVVALGSGTFNITDLDFIGNGSGSGEVSAIQSGQDFLNIGDPTAPFSEYYGLNGPGAFGSNSTAVDADSATGDVVSLQQGVFLVVPAGYVSGATLSSSSTFDDTTLAALGLTPGQSYTWTWGAGNSADSFTIDIADTTAATPEPFSLALVGTGLALAEGMRRRRIQRQS